MQCPVCAADNLDDAIECGGCGLALAPESAGSDEAGQLDGLEPTRLASADRAVHVEALPGVEHTQLEADSTAASQSSAEFLALERTQHEAVAGATPAWTADLEIDRAREPDSGERTVTQPESATCPWCGAVSLGALCDACGRRKSRYLEPQTAAPRAATPTGETVTCPACFSRVSKEVRCSDCGLPFPLQEL
jgi:hypothetical protein